MQLCCTNSQTTIRLGADKDRLLKKLTIHFVRKFIVKISSWSGKQGKWSSEIYKTIQVTQGSSYFFLVFPPLLWSPFVEAPLLRGVVFPVGGVVEGVWREGGGLSLASLMGKSSVSAASPGLGALVELGSLNKAGIFSGLCGLPLTAAISANTAATCSSKSANLLRLRVSSSDASSADLEACFVRSRASLQRSIRYLKLCTQVFS